MFKEYDQYDALGLAQLVRNGEATSEQLLDEAVARVEQRDSALNSVVTKLYDYARAAIRAGLPDGPLRGVPFLLKDLHALCSGAVTSNGSRFFKDNAADHDTELVARYKRSGLVIFGKTNTPEFGLTITTEPVLFGPTRNPWNRGHSAGGSSGGGSCGGACTGRACVRRRRFDPHSFVLLRRVRAQAYTRAQPAGARPRRGLVGNEH